MPVHRSTQDDQLLPPWWIAPRPSLMGRDRHEMAGCRHRSASRPARGAPEPYHHCGVGRTWTHWRCSFSSDQSSWLGALWPHTRRRRLCTKVTLRHLAGRRYQHPAAVYNSLGSPVPAKTPNHFHPQTRSRNETVYPDQTKQVTA